jgi:apolipoprotein D and lipocalin family protein
MAAALALALASIFTGSVAVATAISAAVLWDARPAVQPVSAAQLRGLQPITQALDLASYMGKWYEQRRLDSWFEKDVHGVTAEYALQPSGFVSVLNTSFSNSNNTKKAARGLARRTTINGYLLVSFFPLVEGAYVILYLDPTTSVVGAPNRKLLWLLTRNPEVTPEQVATFERVALANNYAQDQVNQTRLTR